MTLSVEEKNAITEFIRNSDDFLSDDQLKKKFNVSSYAIKKELGFIDFYETTNYEDVFSQNLVLMFNFRPQERFYDQQSPDFSPEWVSGMLGDPNYSQIFLISASNYKKLISGMLEIYLMSNGNESIFDIAENYINDTLIQILALDDATKEHEVKIVDSYSLEAVIKFSSDFQIIIDNKFAPISKSKVILSSGLRLINNQINLHTSLVKAFNGLKTKSLSLDKLCLVLTMDKNFSAIPKPVRAHELEPLLNEFPRFEVIESMVTMLSVAELLSKLTSDQFYDINNIPNFALGEGLLIVKFIGENFPLEQASEYVELRSIVYMTIESDFSAEKLLDVRKNYPELSEVLWALIKDTEIQSWINENLRFGFIHDDLESLKLIFDSLIRDFSPIFNIKKNPGNLFRQIIIELRNKAAHGG